MRVRSLCGTCPWNTRDSVPRLIPLKSARITRSSLPSGGNSSVRISPCPGLVTQNALTWSAIVDHFVAIRVPLQCFDSMFPIMPRIYWSSGALLRMRIVLASVVGCLAVTGVALQARPWVNDFYPIHSGIVFFVMMTIAAIYVSRHHPFGRLGSANYVTVGRAALLALLVGLVNQPVIPRLAWAAVLLAAIIAIFDALDGWLARRTKMASDFGARFDMEIDALLILGMSVLVWQYGKAGIWVLLCGLMRYGFIVAGWLRPWLAQPLRPTLRGRTVCVIQVVGLCVALAPIVRFPFSAIVTAITLVVLSWSFAVDIKRLWYEQGHLPHSSNTVK